MIALLREELANIEPDASDTMGGERSSAAGAGAGTGAGAGAASAALSGLRGGRGVPRFGTVNDTNCTLVTLLLTLACRLCPRASGPATGANTARVEVAAAREIADILTSKAVRSATSCACSMVVGT